MSTNGEPLTWDRVGAEVSERPIQEKYALCRCGKPENKPFCDGTHAKKGFDGTLTADRNPASSRCKTFTGPNVVMTDDPTLCVHAGFCGTRLTNVWKMVKKADDPEVKTRLQEMVANCPSGRLEISQTEDGKLEEPEYAPSVATIPNGPLWVRGGVEIQTMDGFTYEIRNRVTLCRCGQSKNKPFCDGTHGRDRL